MQTLGIKMGPPAQIRVQALFTPGPVCRCWRRSSHVGAINLPRTGNV